MIQKLLALVSFVALLVTPLQAFPGGSKEKSSSSKSIPKEIRLPTSSSSASFDVLPIITSYERQFRSDNDVYQLHMTLRIKNTGVFIKKDSFLAVSVSPIGFLNKIYHYYLASEIALREDLPWGESVPVLLKWELPQDIVAQDSSGGTVRVCVEVRDDSEGPNLETSATHEDSCREVSL